MTRTIFLLLVALVFGAQTSSSSSTLLGAPGSTTLGTIGSTLNTTGSTGSNSQSVVAKPSTSSTSRSSSAIIVCDLVDQTGTLTNVDDVCTSGGLR
jgi:hypothetical protein